MSQDQHLPPGVSFRLIGEGQLGPLIRAKDWSQTSLGAMDTWTCSLTSYVSMILTLPTPAIIFWGPDQIQIYNDGYAVIMGPRHPEHLGSTYEACWPDTYPMIYPWMQRVLQKGEVVQVEKTLIPVTRHGFVEEAFFTFSFSPLRDDNNAIGGLLQIVTEMTDAVLAERRLNTLKLLAPHSALNPLDIQQSLIEPLSHNPADIRFALMFMPGEAQQILKLVGSCGFDHATQELSDIALALLPWVQDAWAANTSVTITNVQDIAPHAPIGPWPEATQLAAVLPLRHSEAEPPRGVIVLGVSPRLQFDDVYAGFFQSIAREISGLLSARQEALTRHLIAKERERLYSVFQQAPVAVCLNEGPDHVFTLANKNYLALFGGNRDVIGRSVRDALPEVATQGYFEKMDSVYQSGKPFIANETFAELQQVDGSTRQLYLNLIYQPRRNEEGSVEGIVTIVSDVTELVLSRKRIEAIAHELQDKEERLKLALQGAQMGVWSIQYPQAVMTSDERFKELHCISHDVDVEKALNRLIHPEDHPLIRTALRKALIEGVPFSCEYRVPTADGSYHWIYARGEPKFDTATGKAISLSGVAFDISDRKLTEAALVSREAEFRSLANSIPQLAWMAKPDGAVYWYNQRWYDYTGTDFERMRSDGWEPLIHPDHLQPLNQFVADARRSESAWEKTFPIKSANGEWRWFLTRTMPIRDRQGKLVSWFGTNTDVHDQMEAEQSLRKLNNELEEFAYVASHDLQEPLRKVSLYASLLLEDLQRGELADLEQYANFITSGVSRMSNLIQDLLAYSRTVHHAQETDIPTADLNWSLADALTVLDTSIKEAKAKIVFSELPLVQADPAQMSLVFQNLIANALKYQPHRQVPEIEIDVQTQGSHWVISVKDNGVGFSAEYSEKIFGLFKRLYKDEYPGTGLGLAICRRIVERYQGEIWAASEGEGTGACFHLRLQQV